LPYAGKGNGQEERMADGTSLPVGGITSASHEVRRTGPLKLLARRKSSVALMLCPPLMVIHAFLMDADVAGATTGATKF
jgi:hypothetical protein